MNLFEAIFKGDPQTPAVRWAGGTLSYGELRRNTLRAANLIVSLGVTPGDRVALLLHDSPEFIELFIATCSLGAIAVPINTALKLESQCSILHDSGAVVAFIEADICNTLLTGAHEKLQFLKEIVLFRRQTGAEAEAGSHFQITEAKLRHPSIRLSDFLSVIETVSDQAQHFPEPTGSDAAFILYTSGSTGDPKGAIHRQQDIFQVNDGFCREVLQLTPNDRLFSSSRLPFAYGLGNSCTFPLLNGATTVLCREKPVPDVVSRILVEHRPTIFFGVPVVYNMLLEHHRKIQPLDCSSLRMCVSAGEALPAHLGENWENEFGVQVLDGIGSTEMLHMFFSNHLNDVRYGSSGKLLENYEAKLLSAEGEAVKNGEEGNLWIKGRSAALGYWQRPQESARTFVDGWVRTGDLYRCDPDGFWFHMGRSDDCFKSSGQWVSPVEVEGILARHPDVMTVAVVEDFDTEQLPCACAFVVRKALESDTAQMEEQLRELVATSLPRYKRPKKYVFVNELPYTATGKVQRFKLRQELRQQQD